MSETDHSLAARYAPDAPRGIVLRAAVLIVLTLAAYFPVRDAGYVWDDDALLTANPNMHSGAGLWRTWTDPRSNLDYYPLMHTSWWLEYRVWGLNPLGYHLNNVLLHIAISLLFWRLLVRLGVPGAWFAALLFAIHPVHVESVAWVSQRKNTLSGLFYIASAYCFLRFHEGDSSPSRDGRRWRWYACSLVLFVAAMFSKPVTMTLAAALPLIAWWRVGRLTKRDTALVLPFFALVVPMALLTMWVQSHHVGATGPEFEYTLPQRLIIAGRVVWFYVGKLVWPTDLTFAYAMWDINSRAIWQWLYPLSVAAALLIAWLRRASLGIGPFLAGCYFVATLSPALGVIPIYWHRYYFVADHVQYFADMGLIALAVGAGFAAARTLAPTPRLLVTCAVVAMPLAAVGASYVQATHYRDEETLWRDTLKKNDKAWMAHSNLALILINRGDLKEGLERATAGRELAPHVPETHHNEGLALLRLRRFGEAIERFNASLRLKDSAAVRNDLGIALAGKKQYDRAIEEYRKALAMEPARCDTRLNLGLAIASSGRVADGAKEVGDAMDAAPNSPQVKRVLGMHLVRDGFPASGLPLLREAIAGGAADLEGMWVLAWELATSADGSVRNGKEAIVLAERALGATNGRSPQLADALAAAQAETGDFASALRTAGYAINLARQVNEPSLAAEIEARASVYAQKRAWHQTSESPASQPAK